ncbi:hypothetical protein GCM10022226_20050 [Sphaerisporangium flaviroseum]|uniref:Histidine kinase/HSP90-like ATPase domain-containing protein n=1 Tax=Sphaerisporangium flaviroseum TaxID=509199 RepID=A0ABP7HNJ6_9ACTN
MTGRDTETRRRGRHRRGVTATHVHPRRWDPAKRAAAQQLDQIEPAWAVWYGLGARCFYAIAIGPVPEPLIVQARTTDELRGLMREAEGHGRHPHPPLRAPHPLGGATMPQTPDGSRVVCWDVPCDLSMVGKTRSMVNETLTGWTLRHLADDVVLVVGELLANAIAYGRPPVAISISTESGRLCVQVTDHGPGQPRLLDLGTDAVHGRGLVIVAALAHECGVTELVRTPGKIVWARWHLSP